MEVRKELTCSGQSKGRHARQGKDMWKYWGWEEGREGERGDWIGNPWEFDLSIGLKKVMELVNSKIRKKNMSV